jgi:hypothetical protein
MLYHVGGLGSSVGTATDYRLDGTFFARVQTGPGAHPASCTMNGYRVFPGGKAAGA